MSHTDAALSRIGPFALEERLGHPPADHVYRGVHVEQRQSFAVRILPAEVMRGPLAEKTFKAEVAALKGLAHPNILRCYGGSIDRGRPFLALDLVQGESVAEQLARRGRLPWETAVEIAEQLCAALEHAHGRETLHERIAPEKILLDAAGRVRLGGFGSAWVDRYTGRRPADLPLSTTRLLAPEQLTGDLPVTVRSDLYGLGAALFLMVTGRPPFAEAESFEALSEAKRTAVPPRIAAYELNAPVWLDVLVARLLAAVPTDRYASAREVTVALAEAKRNVESGVSTAQRALAARSTTLIPEADRRELDRIRRKRVKRKDTSPFYERAWFLALCLAAVVAAITWAVWPPSEDELYRGAAALMASSDTSDWHRAEDKYLIPLRERFPDGKYAVQVQEWIDQIDMEQAERRLEMSARLGKPPGSEAERLYAEGLRYERFGDRITALARYRGILSLLADSERQEDRPFINLAKRRIAEITDAAASNGEGGPADRAEFVRGQLERAEVLVAEGKPLQAEPIYSSIVELYAGNRELEPLVEQARAALAADGE